MCRVPSSNDDMSFFRAMAESLGIGTSHAYKALELRGRIETVLHTGDLLLVLDEGHYLWPQRNMRKAVPHRINWMLTQLVNMGVPVAVVTHPAIHEEPGGTCAGRGDGRLSSLSAGSSTTSNCHPCLAKMICRPLLGIGCQARTKTPSKHSPPTRKLGEVSPGHRSSRASVALSGEESESNRAHVPRRGFRAQRERRAIRQCACRCLDRRAPPAPQKDRACDRCRSCAGILQTLCTPRAGRSGIELQSAGARRRRDRSFHIARAGLRVFAKSRPEGGPYHLPAPFGHRTRKN